jgi:hypothetical protein
MDQEEFLNSVDFSTLTHDQSYQIIKSIDETMEEYEFTENLAKYALEICIKCVKYEKEDFELLKNEIMSLFEKEF